MAKQKKRSAAAKPAVKRTRKKPRYSSFKLSKPQKSLVKAVPKGRLLLKESFRLLWRNKLLFAKILGVYVMLYVLFVRGFSSSVDVSGLIHELQNSGYNQLDIGIGIFSQFLGQAGVAPTELASLYQTLLLIVGSLAIIWTVRRAHADEPVRTKDAYYKGVAPVIPFILVLFVIGLQLLPLSLGSYMYGALQSFGYLETLETQAPALVFVGLLAMLSLYMACSSAVALYIVTLPNVEPMQALRAARELVRMNRIAIVRRVAFLIISLLALCTLLMVPVILLVPSASEVIFLLLLAVSFTVFHTYMYHLYRSLL